MKVYRIKMKDSFASAVVSLAYPMTSMREKMAEMNEGKYIDIDVMESVLSKVKSARDKIVKSFNSVRGTLRNKTKEFTVSIVRLMEKARDDISALLKYYAEDVSSETLESLLEEIEKDFSKTDMAIDEFYKTED